MTPQFDAPSFWRTIKRYAGTAAFVPDAVALYFCMIDGATPVAARVTIACALAYVVLPTDAIPDWVPVSSMIDDGAVLAFTLAMVQVHVTDEHRRKTQEWFAR